MEGPLSQGMEGRTQTMDAKAMKADAKAMKAHIIQLEAALARAESAIKAECTACASRGGQVGGMWCERCGLVVWKNKTV